VSRPLVWTLYAALVLVWSSTWVVIAVGLEDIAPFFGAGIRFSLAGLGVLVAALATRRPLKTDFVLSAIVGLLPFATTYGLIYWAEQYVTSGLTSVLFGVLPLYVALIAAVTLPEEPLRPRLLAGVGIALVGLVAAFGESLDLGSGEHTALAAVAVVLSPLASAVGNVAIKKRGRDVDPLVMNGWAMLAGGLVLLAISAPTEDWGATVWSAESIGSILYLAAFGTGFTFVTLTVLLRELPAVTVSFISMIIPFGALALGALVRDEVVTALAVGGALLVVLGIAVAQFPVRRAARMR
jgi:drug/metabolite transporter (DMT)-like permease